MGAHGFPGALRIMMLDRIEDSLVMILPPLGTALDLEDPHPLFTEQSHDRIDQGKNQGIRRRFRQGQMKIEIGFDAMPCVT